MSFLKFIKRIRASSAKVEEEISTEAVKLAELTSWIKNQKNNISKEEREFLGKINTRTSQLADELEKEVTALQEVNLDDLKVEKRAKSITKINLDKYVEHLKNLVETLQCFDVTTSNNLMENLTEIFKDFEQKSMKNFQKAAFLAGHKLGTIGVSTGRFFKDIRQLMKDNSSMIKHSNIIISLYSKLSEVDNLEKTQLEFKSKITSFEQKILELSDKEKTIIVEMEQVKKSKSYASDIKKLDDFAKNKSKLLREIHKLRELIDFKFLANTFHSNPKQLTAVREYNTHFTESFQGDSGKKLVSLLRDAEVTQSTVFDHINELVLLKHTVDSTVIEPDQVSRLNNDIEKVKLQMKDMLYRKEVEQKKHDKFQASKEHILAAMRNKLSEINVVLK
jgi:hypothetical protein